jgi:hypothetical protein
MDAELKQYLEEMEARLEARSEEMEARLKTHTSLECEKIETKLLREFWKWGSTSDIRTRQSMETTNALNERMLNVEDRISALERSRLPPHADAA